MTNNRRSQAQALADQITLKDLQAQFDKPITKAAIHFRICVSLLKRVCRSYGIPKWPQRTIRSLKRQIRIFQDQLQIVLDPYQRANLQGQLGSLQQRLATFYETEAAPGPCLLHRRGKQRAVRLETKALVPEREQNPSKAIHLPSLRSIIPPHTFLPSTAAVND